MKRWIRHSHFSATKFRDAAASHDFDANNCIQCSSALFRQESIIPTDRASQVAAIKSINSYFSTHNFPIFHKPLPPAKDITEAFHFLLRDFGWEMSKLDDDVPFLLKQLGCPLKLRKSVFKPPGTPHSWHPLLSAMHWLVQFLAYNEHLQSDPFQDQLTQYIITSYSHYMNEDDEVVATLDEQYL